MRSGRTMLLREAGPQSISLHAAGHGSFRADGPERSSHINVPRMPRGLLETHGLEPTCPDSSPLFYVFVHGIMITISMATVSNSIYFMFSFPPATSLLIIKSF